MRLTRALWGVLAVALAVVVAATWLLTRPQLPPGPWVGAVSVLAGDGRDGWRDGAPSEARFSEPFGLAVAPDDVVFVSDAGTSHRIRRIDLDGTVTTVAGGGRGFADGRGARARFATPSAIAMAPDGTLVVADTGNHAIRRVATDGEVTTVAGDGVPGYVDGPAAQARFNAPVGVALDQRGRIIVADTYNDRIRVIDTDGQVRTLAGGQDPAPSPASATGDQDGPHADARFDTPCGVAVDRTGRVLVADTGNGLIRVIGLDGVVTTMPSPLVGLERPIAIASAANGDVYVVDERGAVALLPTQGDARLVAGGVSGFADGVAGEAGFRRPSALALWTGPAGQWVGPPVSAGRAHIIVADAGNAMIRLMRPTPIETVGPAFAQALRGANANPTATSSSGCVAAGLCPAVDWSWPWSEIALPAPPRPRLAPAFDAEAFGRTPLLWPVAPMDGPHEVAGTFGEARGEAGQERFHAGLDVREVQGTPVRAVRDGIVSSPIATAAFDTLNESVRIGPLAYIHIRVGRTRPGTGPRVAGTGSASAGGRPNSAGVGAGLVRHGAADGDLRRFAPVYDANGVLTRMRAKRGAFFAAGDLVGTVNAFNHVHLNVGWSGEEHNPLRFRLVQFRDGIAPTIAAAGVRVFDEAWLPLNPDRTGPPRGRGRARRLTRLPPLEPVVVRGRVRIVVDAWDQADGNPVYRRLGLYRVGFQVLDRGGVPVRGFEMPRDGIEFDRLRRESDAARDVYAAGSGIPVYGASRTQFLYVATTTYRDGIATPGFWDTTLVPPGQYVVRVFVQDFSGNRTTRDVRVAVVVP